MRLYKAASDVFTGGSVASTIFAMAATIGSLDSFASLTVLGREPLPYRSTKSGCERKLHKILSFRAMIIEFQFQ